ncbi:hypothetical protein LNKW23_31790 [Paralimibaculum aggregatum]|uniref:Peptidoglycan binding-like domain-containing protein n=1 Tax=Paralimibaculum aggregatum TaxID=3036245 RepID=A0ABQ6LRR2_9RHOB|nr:peptidoglycan-binding domain-containing protein [Limibaculum sp. NKW23]GMG83965.1 hypothetical protein LNKW23_31790 [Limibaculum sp. NKW23]
MPALSEGSTGSPVRKLQIDLNKVLASGLKANGTFDGKTKDAVVRFQKKAGLSTSGTADTGTVKALKSHVRGLDWPHGDPAADKASISDAIEDVKRNAAAAKASFGKAEQACRAAADLLKKNGAGLATAATEAAAKWGEEVRLLEEMARHRKDFDAARKAHDLARQQEILAKARALEARLKPLADKGYASFEEMGRLATAGKAAIKGLAKLDAKKA